MLLKEKIYRKQSYLVIQPCSQATQQYFQEDKVPEI